jgi:NAD(P)-dependent dehydrogenase (short-subunit alcohol dehydrogenase family)
MSGIVVITGASSGFGALTARALADAGNTVYAGMRQTTTRNAPQVQAAADYSEQHGVDLRSIELDVSSQESVDAAIDRIVAEQGRIDVLVHNAGHMVTGPAEAFTPSSSPSSTTSTYCLPSASTGRPCRICARRGGAW